MKPDRLLSTPDHEITAALERTPRGKFVNLSTVYVVSNDTNSLLKIGYADNLKHRLSGLNGCSPVPLSLVHFVHVVDGVVAVLVEGLAHKTLAEFRRRGEWFDVTPLQAADAIGAALAINRVKWWTEYERRKLSVFAKGSVTRNAQHERIFGD